METRTGCYRAFRQHMMTAVCDCIGNIAEHLTELLRGDPVFRIVAVVVVTVHRHNIGELKIGIAAGIIRIQRAHMVERDRLAEICFRYNDLLIRVDRVFRIAGTVGSIQCELHVVSSNSSLK